MLAPSWLGLIRKSIFAFLLASAAQAQAQGKGLVLLPLLSKKFPVQGAARVLSKTKTPAFSFLYKSFGNHEENLAHLLATLIPTSTTITSIVYFDCGPCRPPRRPAGLFSLVLPSLDIDDLSYQLELGYWQTQATLFLHIFTLLESLPQNEKLTYIIHPALEDNYTSAARKALSSLIKEAALDRPDIKLGINPLAPQARGRGVPLEIHSSSADRLRGLHRGDILSMDGERLKYPGEPGGVEYGDARALIATAERKGVTVLLWRPEFQGLPPLTDGGTRVLIPPSNRVYKISRPRYLMKLIQDKHGRNNVSIR